MTSSENTLTDSNFQYFVDYIQQTCGLVLQKNQLYLLENRLIPIMRQYNIPTLNDVVERLKKQDPSFGQTLVEALVTHESSFFRDKKVFDFFAQEILEKLYPKASSLAPLNIWSAACSSGQEPYSIAMLMKDFAQKTTPLIPISSSTCHILATDISKKILDKAQAGSFSHFEVQRGLPVTLLIKYFKKDETNWMISKELKDLIKFENYNLTQPRRIITQTFHVIFCRNVLIYFNECDKLKVIQHLHSHLKSGGHLILGSSEFILQTQTNQLALTPVKDYPGIYQKS
ncbi:CheR family methyltransferase [Candidatus Bodocaedibacter vickermanii]|uniref:protein-glutamate O-methyltransferase n=1 Tax=Candidatus Bodocaedibacter vickermanii TaxID=2741701 RepID=A0A7L9RT83_9PROT|nr:Chemotaxis protein methyltransferase Cher2 [Candidatus Paracaedibacteraceae bacterium 'Lake Konstanz']